MQKNAEVDKYIADVPDDFRPFLIALREKIFEYMPEGEETFAYNIPVYKLGGKAIFSIAAFKNHYSIVTQDKYIIDKIPEFAKFKISGTTVHFTAEHPITDALLKKFIELRIAERENGIS